ncbi:(S)-limonene 6-monooxygenase [Variovorax sp. PBL-H6]|uniref:sigma-54 interaction domain-containing protein n=1 Tax=Variovorax sp. PBL-H6 TaxID=434009 RepID=UPI001317F84E|nr:sigma 54-interacting transcriptional regulator [Variovorax sp. PBL-H6]VTU25032.1 (S)-limonene 6-monooxygenase [Variovorax sp. PBL-H6]
MSKQQRDIAQELQQVRQTCRDFEDILRNSFDGIFVADGDGMTLFVNEGCERNYGVKASQLIGQHVSEFERKGWIRPVIAGKVAQSKRRISTTQQTHEGKTIMVTGIPLLDEQGRVRRVIINSRDMTELVNLQQVLAQAKENLQRVDSEIAALRNQALKFDGVVLQSPAMQRLAELAVRVAKVNSTVLLTGESGVGKEVVTRLIHTESPRAKGPFIKINCGALPRELLETELFGYEPGAFTGAQRQGKHGLIELAAEGTLFLDEIGEMAPDLQVKLLTVLQDRVVTRVGGTRALPVDVRVIAATNRDLKEMVAQRSFRSDLYYRLNVVPIHVPPLAERREDILPLIHHFSAEFCRQYALERRISERVLRRLHDYRWPGNVRELRNVVERLVVTSPQPLIGLQDLDGVLSADAEGISGRGSLREQLERFESGLLEEAMRAHGSTRGVAKALGISQSSVVRKLRIPRSAA